MFDDVYAFHSYDALYACTQYANSIHILSCHIHTATRRSTRSSRRPSNRAVNNWVKPGNNADDANMGKVEKPSKHSRTRSRNAFPGKENDAVRMNMCSVDMWMGGWVHVHIDIYIYVYVCCVPGVCLVHARCAYTNARTARVCLIPVYCVSIYVDIHVTIYPRLLFSLST